MSPIADIMTTQNLCLKDNILKIQDIFKTTALKFYFNFCHNLVPNYFQSCKLKARFDFHSYNIRSQYSLHLTKTNTKVAERSIRHVLPRLVNDTSSLILDKIYTHSIKGYTYIKQFY